MINHVEIFEYNTSKNRRENTFIGRSSVIYYIFEHQVSTCNEVIVSHKCVFIAAHWETVATMLLIYSEITPPRLHVAKMNPVYLQNKILIHLSNLIFFSCQKEKPTFQYLFQPRIKHFKKCRATFPHRVTSNITSP